MRFGRGEGRFIDRACAVRSADLPAAGELRAADGRLYDNEVIHFGKQRRTRRAACAYLPEASRIRSVNSSRGSSPSRLPRFVEFDGGLSHFLMGFLGAADQAEVVAPGDAAMLIPAVQAHAQQQGGVVFRCVSHANSSFPVTNIVPFLKKSSRKDAAAGFNTEYRASRR